MARYLGPSCKLSRREGRDLLLKSGIKPIDAKCKLKTPPGQHGVGQAARGGISSRSDFALHLREKQKLRRTYGVLERQFRNYYRRAARSRAATGEALIQLLESRLDNLVYRMGFAVTRAQARQLVSHRKILLDGKIANIPSLIVRPGLRVQLTEKVRGLLLIKDAVSRAEVNGAPEWIDVDYENCSGVMREPPTAAAAAPDVNANLIVEFYSK